jgi:hypothetical protein
MNLKRKYQHFQEVAQFAKQYPKEQRKFVFKDYLSLFEKKGLTFDEYRDFEFERQNADFRHSFLGFNEQRYYLDYLNPKKYYILSRNKFLAHWMLERVGVRFAELYAYYSPEGVITTEPDIAQDLSSLMDIFRRKGVNSCAIKSTEGSHGEGVTVVNSIEYGDSDCMLEFYNGERAALSSILGREPLIFEKVVKQTKQMSAFNETSVNTIRFMTTLMPSGDAKIIAIWFKMGRKGSCVDNAGNGGNIDGCVDIATGELKYAVQFDGWRQLKPVECHPDSGTQINGVRIDNWEAIKAEVIKYQQAFPFCKAAGWDIAITDDGPVVIEVNDMWDTTGQLFIHHGWRDGVRDCFFQWRKTGAEYIMSRDLNVLSTGRLKKIAAYE